MAPVNPVAWIQSRLQLLNVAFVSSFILSVGATVLYVCVFLITVYAWIPENKFEPTQIYPADQNATPLGSLTVDEAGRGVNYTLSGMLGSSIGTFTAGGEAVEVTSSGGTATVRLRARAIAPGTYFLPDVNVTAEGVLSGIRDGTPIDASEVTHGGGTVAGALAASFLVRQASAALSGERVFDPSAGDFDADVGTPGQYLLSAEPSPVASSACAHTTSLTFGTGVKTAACVAGAAPGTPGGAATLGADGNVPMAQLPATMNLEFRGLWDPALNVPALSTPSCGSNDRFYYFVSNNGNRSIASFFVWTSKEMILCTNGTWSKIDGIAGGLASFNGRTADVTSQFGDYPSGLVPVPGGTLTDVGLAPFVVTTPTPFLPNALVLQGAPGQITVSGGVLGLADVPVWGGTNASFSGILRNPCIDRFGRITCGTSAPLTVASVSSSQITVTGSTNLVLSLPQGTTTTSAVQFGGLTVNGTRVTASGSGTVTIPNVGAGSFLLTEGAKTITGAKSFESSVVVTGDQGVRLNNGANTASVTIRRATTGTGTVLFNYPADQGTNGAVLVSTGSGGHVWQNATTPLTWIPYTPTIGLFFNTDPPGFVVSAFYRGAGTVGSLMEVRATLDITPNPGNTRYAVTLSLPVGTITTPLGGRTNGYCTVDGGPFIPRIYGWVSENSLDSSSVYMGIEETDDLNIFGLWVCRFAYVVA